MKKVLFRYSVFALLAAGFFFSGDKLSGREFVASAMEETVSEAGIEQTQVNVSQSTGIVAKSYTLTAEHKRFFKKLSPGDEFRVRVRLGKNMGINPTQCQFISGNKKIATVSKKGVITAKKNGSVVITVKYKKNPNLSCSLLVTVADRSVRTLFLADSRGVDIFTARNVNIYGTAHNGIVVFAVNGANIIQAEDIMDRIDLDDYDKIISWMGVNDYGHFERYTGLYTRLIRKNKKLVLCTIGASSNVYLPPEDYNYFGNHLVDSFNTNLRKFAKKHHCKVVDLHKYCLKHVSIDNVDGLHYSPKPNKKLWKYIVNQTK